MQTKCELTVGKASIRPFGHITQFMGKVGPNIFIEINSEACILRGLDNSNASFGSATFHHTFFERFQAPQSTIRCKVAVKCFIAAFKNLRGVNALEMHFGNSDIESVLEFRLRCHMGIVKKYTLGTEDCEIFDAVFDAPSCLNQLECSSQKLSQIFSHLYRNNQAAMHLADDFLRV